jgi:hypothetical protein
MSDHPPLTQSNVLEKLIGLLLFVAGSALGLKSHYSLLYSGSGVGVAEEGRHWDSRMVPGYRLHLAWHHSPDGHIKRIE